MLQQALHIYVAQLRAIHPLPPSFYRKKKKDLHAMFYVSFSMLQIMKRKEESERERSRSLSPNCMSHPFKAARYLIFFPQISKEWKRRTRNSGIPP
jgi:hypothetical protein